MTEHNFLSGQKHLRHEIGRYGCWMLYFKLHFGNASLNISFNCLYDFNSLKCASLLLFLVSTLSNSKWLCLCPHFGCRQWISLFSFYSIISFLMPFHSHSHFTSQLFSWYQSLVHLQFGCKWSGCKPRVTQSPPPKHYAGTRGKYHFKCRAVRKLYDRLYLRPFFYSLTVSLCFPFGAVATIQPIRWMVSQRCNNDDWVCICWINTATCSFQEVVHLPFKSDKLMHF